MSKLYMCLIRNEQGGCEEPSASQMDEMFAKFQSWQEKFADNISDMGGKLGEGKVLNSNNGIIDGPFVEVKEIIGGYMMLKAENIDEALQVARECPPIADSLAGTSTASIELREVFRP